MTGSATVSCSGSGVNRPLFQINSPCYLCERDRGSLTVPLTGHGPTHFYVRCPGCKALWKLTVDASDQIVGAPDPPWYSSYNELAKRPRKSATELLQILREGVEGLYTGRDRSAAAALRQAIELCLFAEILEINLDKKPAPDWTDAMSRLRRKYRDSEEGRAYLRELEPHLTEIYDVGLAGVHARPKPGAKAAGTAQIGAAFSRFDDLLQLLEKPHGTGT
jgi:hypothetical protein